MRRFAALLAAAALSFAQPADLTAKSRRGKELMAAGRFAEAVSVYSELVRSLPTNTGLRLNLALALQMAGRQREAIPEFERVLKQEPSSVPALLSLGVARLETNDPERAVAPLSTVVKLQPREVNARGMLANALLSLDRPAEAAPHFRKLIELTPDDPKAWYGLGRSYEALAGQAFEQLEKIAPESSWTLALLGDSRVQAKQYRGAFFFYRSALQKNPEMNWLHAELAAVYKNTGHADWAAAEETAAEQGPPPVCTANPRRCAFLGGRYLEAASPLPAAADPESLYWSIRADNLLALEAFSALVKLPPSVEVHQLMAEMHRNHGEHAEAVKDWQAALAMQPDNPRLKHELAISMFLGRNFEAVLPLLDELLRQDPGSAELNYLKGDSLLQMEKAEAAVPFLEQAARAGPKLLAAHAALGLAYARTGKAAEAIPQLQSALELDEDGSLHYQLSRAYGSTGHRELASKTLAEYQAIQKKLQQAKQELESETQITAP